MVQVFASGGLLLLLDQWSKRIVQLRVRAGCIHLGPILRIRSTRNTKEFYKRNSVRTLLVLTWFTALLSAILLHQSGAWFQSQAAMLGLGLAFGGAAGNLLDILRRRCIIDFIDLRWWPVFNLADVAIIAGLVLAFWPHR